MRIRGEAKPLDYYLELNYPVTLYRAEEGGFAAEIEDLLGCLTQGETIEEAIENIEEARKLWLKVAYEDGVEIPIPRTDEKYSGRFLVRLPKSLHRRLTEQAKREGVSLNQYVETLLSSGISTCEAKIEEVVDKIIVEKLRQLMGQLFNITPPVVPHAVYPAVIKFEIEKEQHEVQSYKDIRINEREMISA